MVLMIFLLDLFLFLNFIPINFFLEFFYFYFSLGVASNIRTLQEVEWSSTYGIFGN